MFSGTHVPETKEGPHETNRHARYIVHTIAVEKLTLIYDWGGRS